MNTLPVPLQAYPAAALVMDGVGTVLDSNGRIEEYAGRPVCGARLHEVLDTASSAGKLDRILATPEAATQCELVLRGRETLEEPRRFTALRHPAGSLLLIEHVHDARLDGLRKAVTEVNTALANTQRDLVRERARLAHALEELEARNRETEQINRALDEFAHAVSHDLKTPLRAITNHARWLGEDAVPALDENAREHLDRIVDRAQRLRRMIDAVLEYARAGRRQAQPEDIDVASLIAEVIDLIDVPSGVEIEVAPALPVVRAPRSPLHQILLNLIGNAVRHAGDGESPRVCVDVAETGAEWIFSVTDNGPGVPPRLHERVWQLFGTAAGDGAESSGIGLAVVRRLVESNGGGVALESEAGAGATFRFTWPRPSAPGRRTA